MLEALLAGVLVCANLSWEAPQFNVDGSLIREVDPDTGEVVRDIAKYTIHYGQESRIYNQTADDIPADALELQICPAAPGVTFFAITVTDTDGSRSDYSNEVSKDIVDLLPAAVTTLQQNEQVYTVVKQRDRFVLVAVGTVPAGTSCDLRYAVSGLGPNDVFITNAGAVPRASVNWTSPTGSRPEVVVARCGGG